MRACTRAIAHMTHGSSVATRSNPVQRYSSSSRAPVVSPPFMLRRCRFWRRAFRSTQSMGACRSGWPSRGSAATATRARGVRDVMPCASTSTAPPDAHRACFNVRRRFGSSSSRDDDDDTTPPGSSLSSSSSSRAAAVVSGGRKSLTSWATSASVGDGGRSGGSGRAKGQMELPAANSRRVRGAAPGTPTSRALSVARPPFFTESSPLLWWSRGSRPSLPFFVGGVSTMMASSAPSRAAVSAASRGPRRHQSVASSLRMRFRCPRPCAPSGSADASTLTAVAAWSGFLF
mmetsp:Transcript_6437/g.27101  ORF Transcript_6437/g.27101 Transcript_6437/m.27101 type:complete len:289 (+) Transcript_6437:244-1110(+)